MNDGELDDSEVEQVMKAMYATMKSLEIDADGDGDGFGDNIVGNDADDCVETYGTSTELELFGCVDYDGDGYIDVIDIVQLVNTILDWTYNPLGDLNEDGTNDVIDIVLLVSLVLY